jgi:hypothetical protein
MLCVFAGGSFHSNFGETSCASHVNLLGMTSPSEKSGLVIRSAMAPPFDCEKSFPEHNVKMQSRKPLRTANLLRTAASSLSHLSRSMVAEKFSDFSMAALLREIERRLSVIRLGLQIGAA